MRLVAPCLAQLARAKRQIIVMASAEARCGLLYPDGWAQLGIDPALILLIQTERLADRLWALEQSLKSAAFGALLAWLPETRPDALRRLQLAAAKASGLSFLVRSASAQMHCSPAPLRLLLGRAQHSLIEDRLLSVRIIKRRGPVLDEALLLKLSDPRPLRSRSLAHRLPARTPSVMSFSVLEHAVGRPPLSNTAPRSHPTSAA
jgi:protein ImuA